MSHALTPSPTSPATGGTTVLVPDAGDNRTALSVSTPIQTLLNLVMYIWGAISGSIAASLTFAGPIAILNTLYVSNNVFIDGTFNTLSACVLNSVTVTTNATIGGNALVTGTVAANSATISGVIVANRYRDTNAATVIGTDANTTFDANTVRTIIVPDGALTNSRTYTLSGGFDGIELEVVNGNNSFAITVTPTNVALSGSASFSISRATVGGRSSIRLKFKSGYGWAVLSIVSV